MTSNDIERQNKGFYGIIWRFQAATQVYIIGGATELSLCDPDTEFGICILT